MAESLTKDEFFKRLEKRLPLLAASMVNEFEHSETPMITRKVEKPSGDICMDITEAYADVLRNTLVKAVHLCYLDMQEATCGDH